MPSRGSGDARQLAPARHKRAVEGYGALRIGGARCVRDPDPSSRLHAALRGNHEQMMLEALLMRAPDAHGGAQHGVGADA